ncbi:MAG: hypothetical protein M1812_004654 [Candelaria pacifica]|nr:MAG: hypothetical protein M1812_004654 [Candelaria pacifica]
MIDSYFRFLSQSTAIVIILYLSLFIRLTCSARSSVGTNGAYSEVGPRDIPPACSSEYGFPRREDCIQALDYMIEDIVPAGYDWHGLNALGNVHNAFGIQAREFRTAEDGRQRIYPEYDKVELPRAWLFGEHNGVRLEIYGPYSTLKSYPLLLKLCGVNPTSSSSSSSSSTTSHHTCNLAISALHDATFALTQALGSIWNSGLDVGAGPLGQGEGEAEGQDGEGGGEGDGACKENMYTFDKRRVCSGFIYKSVVDVNVDGRVRGENEPNGFWGILFGVIGKRGMGVMNKFEEVGVFLLVREKG